MLFLLSDFCNLPIFIFSFIKVKLGKKMSRSLGNTSGSNLHPTLDDILGKLIPKQKVL